MIETEYISNNKRESEGERRTFQESQINYYANDR